MHKVIVFIASLTDKYLHINLFVHKFTLIECRRVYGHSQGYYLLHTHIMQARLCTLTGLLLISHSYYASTFIHKTWSERWLFILHLRIYRKHVYARAKRIFISEWWLFILHLRIYRKHVYARLCTMLSKTPILEVNNSHVCNGTQALVFLIAHHTVKNSKIAMVMWL